MADSRISARTGTRAHALIEQMFHAVCARLAYAIVEDGEGVTRVARIHVVGAKTETEAMRCARQVGSSSLVKTMLASGDPNVGRIAGAVGAAGVSLQPKQLDVTIGGHAVVRRGTAVSLAPRVARTILRPRHVEIRIHLHAGRAEGELITADLTQEYVRINAHYTT